MTATTTRAGDEREALLPCPFCGGKDISKYQTTGDERVGYTDTISLTCYPCGVTVSRRSETDKNGWANEPGDKLEARVIAAWNRRAALATAPEQAGEPVGWKLVPMKHEGRAGLTDAMMRAFYEAWALNEQRGSFERLNAAYNAMLTAAPPPASTNRLTDAEILELWTGDPTHSCPVLGKTKILAFARAIRSQALEEAAQICDRMVSVSAVSYETGTACAGDIRALKDPQ